MNVAELREALEQMPGHWPVSVEIHVHPVAGSIDRQGQRELHYTLDCVSDNFPTHGGTAVVRLNYEPT